MQRPLGLLRLRKTSKQQKSPLAFWGALLDGAAAVSSAELWTTTCWNSSKSC
jgi:hypothetical protein